MLDCQKAKKLRKKKCRNCKSEFSPFSSWQVACSGECALVIARAARAKEEAKKAAKDRAKTRADKQRIKTRREWMAEAQKAYNAYIRERDIAQPCICCGGYPTRIGSPGGQWDAGHYLSVGSHPELRFDEDNCHRQLKTCNAGSGKYSHKGRTVSQEYRLRLIDKIGLARVERLEGPHEIKKYTIDELKAIKEYYTSRRKELEKDRL